MILIVGLGNPGRKFQKTRHNIGFRVVDEFVRKCNFPNFRLSKKVNALISEERINNEKIVVAKPQTFMNNSGKSVKLLITGYSLLVTNLWVIHDDIDIPLGKIRIIKNRGAAGHKGVESIIKELKSKNFIRLRIGIRPKNYTLKPKTLDRFALQKFNKEEEKIVKEVIEKSIEVIEMVLEKGLEKAMSFYNK